ncbi:hypothetical protein RHSIM_Rhsim03G0183100 [Rhododendron simsii]|uniref:Uncharacterized protein n=1 Tax=Rhododendron simsii TaxID=118357 RepID=A0A834H4L4_RHOSS|nr:hypothetical protein RHSIM_Rhsim03G0183100 [Rhododendron simsii]
MVRTKRLGTTAASSSAPVPDIVEEQASSGSKEPVAGQSSRGSRKRLRRTGKQVQADKRAKWKEGMVKRRFKNERQVKAKSIGNDHLVMQRIRSKAASFGDNELPPHEKIDDGLINNVLYTNPKNAKIPHLVGEFRDDIRVLNKAFHHNLYPRGLEHKPSRKSGELMYAFMNSKLVVDWAKFIFNQLIDFKKDTISSARMPFPCMITSIYKQKGVKGNDYRKMERLDPGPITGAFLKKSKPRSGVLKESLKAFLTTKPGLKEKKDSLLNKLFCQNVAILKCLWKSEEKRKKEKMERKKLSKEVGKLRHGVFTYEAPLEEELVDSSVEEEEEDDESDEDSEGDDDDGGEDED